MVGCAEMYTRRGVQNICMATGGAVGGSKLTQVLFTLEDTNQSLETIF